MGVFRKLLVALGLAKKKAAILFIGLTNSGKTAIVNTLRAEKVEDLTPTVGFSVEKFAIKKCKLTVIDMSGADRYQSLWATYYKEVQAVVFVVDSAESAERMAEAKEALISVMPHVQSVPLLVLANKQDLPTARAAAKVAEELALHSLSCPAHRISGCSALQGTGIDEAISWLLPRLPTR
mmetsp:Transcript_20186/g.65713  ORF Transcript_20186/g.65713 Transcript_20186/m.65713 type:complete len:180 (+) Transcript_20186:212-751(+)